MPQEIKTVGASGQISLGKQYAGRTVIVEKTDDGVWMIRTASVVPDNEHWLHMPQAKASLDRALEWSAKNKRIETDLSRFPETPRRKR